MINVNLQVRRAIVEDHRQIASLMFHDASMHRHLDWRTPLEWLGSSNYWVLENNGYVSAALACPEDPPQVAWIRLFTHQPLLSGPEAWQPLWEMVHATAVLEDHTQIAAIVVKPWFQNLLLSSGFELKQNIVLLELMEFAQFIRPPSDVRIRPMRQGDLPAVAQLDREAFGPFWHNSLDALQRAHSQAVYASMAENDSGVIGYQLSTGNSFGAHLARLGVGGEAQGRGIGSALVSDLIHQLAPMHRIKLTVNTQSDNHASLALYKKLGFVVTGEQYPVLAFPVGD
jgi:ribosomal protein S18 acetylase RimI-like enzyme